MRGEGAGIEVGRHPHSKSLPLRNRVHILVPPAILGGEIGIVPSIAAFAGDGCLGG